LRLIRELLAYEPQHSGTDIKMALDKVNQILKRRSIVFLVSDFMADPESYRQEMAITNKRHDLIAIDLNDPLDKEISDVGLLALEDPESGEIVWVDTGDKAWQHAFAMKSDAFEEEKTAVFRKSGVDQIDINTNQEYTIPLTAFFHERANRRRR